MSLHAILGLSCCITQSDSSKGHLITTILIILLLLSVSVIQTGLMYLGCPIPMHSGMSNWLGQKQTFWPKGGFKVMQLPDPDSVASVTTQAGIQRRLCYHGYTSPCRDIPRQQPPEMTLICLYHYSQVAFYILKNLTISSTQTLGWLNSKLCSNPFNLMNEMPLFSMDVSISSHSLLRSVLPNRHKMRMACCSVT